MRFSCFSRRVLGGLEPQRRPCIYACICAALTWVEAALFAVQHGTFADVVEIVVRLAHSNVLFVVVGAMKHTACLLSGLTRLAQEQKHSV
jgi:hypothetical protein